VYTTFLVDVKSNTYYKPYGEQFQLSKEHSYDKWFYQFLEAGKDESISLNFNVNRELTLYFNTAIYDDNHTLIGITGMGLRFPYIDRLFKHFRDQYDITITFYNDNAKLIMSGLVNGIMPGKLYQQQYVESMIQDHHFESEFTKDGVNYFLRMRYIPELDSYIVVESKIDDFINGIKRTFYINIFIAIVISVFILTMVISLVRKNQDQLEYFANKDPLTQLSNRRHFTHRIQDCFELSKRNDMALSLLFLDLDDFKEINDSLGHEVGDDVLKRVATLLVNNIRKTDFVGRWGGEEFVILFTNTEIKNAEKLAQKLCRILQQDRQLMTLLNKPQTGSFGLTQVFPEDETIGVAVAEQIKQCIPRRKKVRTG
jgi:diguanylate cyclase (GGDEF)-like protein